MSLAFKELKTWPANVAVYTYNNVIAKELLVCNLTKGVSRSEHFLQWLTSYSAVKLSIKHNMIISN